MREHFIPPRVDIEFIKDDIRRLVATGHRDAIKTEILDWLLGRYAT